MNDTVRKPPLAALSTKKPKRAASPTKWRTLLALGFMIIAIALNWNWFWAGLIALGVIEMLYSGEIHFVEEINKWESPKIYWFMVVFWTLLSLYSIASLYIV